MTVFYIKISIYDDFNLMINKQGRIVHRSGKLVLRFIDKNYLITTLVYQICTSIGEGLKGEEDGRIKEREEEGNRVERRGKREIMKEKGRGGWMKGKKDEMDQKAKGDRGVE